MITVFGHPVILPPTLSFLANAVGSFLATILVWAAIAALTYVVFARLLHWVALRLPGEIEDIVLHIVRKPITVVIAIYGMADSLRLLPLPPSVTELLERVVTTALIAAVVYLLWRVIRDIIMYYGNRWARNTESRVDDVAVPLVNLLGPLVLVVGGLLLILPLWGINVTSVLLGAGVIGLVLGLALQETLSNIFSGMSLLIDAPFRTHDLIIMPDGRACEVQRIGLRSTLLYSVDDHSTVYVPNKLLSSSLIVNITKPTSERKVFIDFSVDSSTDLAKVKHAAERIASSHPCVLARDVEQKIPLVEERIALSRRRVESLRLDDPVRECLVAEIDAYERAIVKLRREGQLDQQLAAFRQSIEHLAQAIASREASGFSADELRELRAFCAGPAEAQCRLVMEAGAAWSAAPDPWADDRENSVTRQTWLERNDRLSERWERLKAAVDTPWRRLELRIDDESLALLQWLNEEYKPEQHAWKSPQVSFKTFQDGRVALQLWFHIDNIRLEHYWRTRRVTTEVARQLHDYLISENPTP